MRRHRLVAALFALAAAVPAAAQWSDDGDAPGFATAQAFRPMPQDMAVAVRPLDDSPAHVELARNLAAALRRRGVPVSDTAPLALNFGTEIRAGSAYAPVGDDAAARRRPHIGPPDREGRSDNVDVNVRIYSNERPSVITGTRPRQPHMRYDLHATLDDQRSGARLWQGQVVYDGAAPDDRRLFAEMAPRLVALLGVSAPERRFRID